MIERMVYECQYCKKLFRTTRHKCKFDPKLKNCFTCSNFDGWENDTEWDCIGVPNPPYPICESDFGDDWDIRIIKDCNYNMQCKGWKQKQIMKEEEC